MIIRITKPHLRKKYAARRLAKDAPIYDERKLDKRQVLFNLDNSTAQRLIAEGKAALPQPRPSAEPQAVKPQAAKPQAAKPQAAKPQAAKPKPWYKRLFGF